MPINRVTNREMAEMPSVFGGERQTPHSVFEKSRAEAGWDPDRPNAGPVIQTKPNDLARACPTCRAEGNPAVRLYAQDKVGVYCLRGHKFADLDVLEALAPDKLPFVGQKAKQEGFRELRLEMPGSTLDQLQKKFQGNLPETVAAIMDVIAQNRFMLISEDDLERVEQLFGQPLKNGAHLFGLIYAAKEKDRGQVEELEKLRARAEGTTGVASANAVTVELDPQNMEKLVAKAAGAPGSPTLQQWLAEQVNHWTANDWL